MPRPPSVHCCREATLDVGQPWDSRVLNGFGGTRPGEAFPVGQTLGQTASFRQTAPETWGQSRGLRRIAARPPKTVKHPGQPILAAAGQRLAISRCEVVPPSSALYVSWRSVARKATLGRDPPAGPLSPRK